MIAFGDINSEVFERFALAVRPSFAPRPIVPSWEWVCRHGRTPDSQPFDGDLMPWAKGVCEAWDNPEVREIVLMWGTRLGKTMVSMQLISKAMATNPLPGLIGTANEKLATRTTREKLYKVLAAIKETKRQLLPERLRSNKEIRLTESTWPVIWSGSNTMLADWGACYGWANEVSKWDQKKTADGQAKAGDTLAQFHERFKEFWHSRKILFECSPALKGHCKIERKYLESNQCKFHVPCPHCKHHQILKMGIGDGTGGIVYDKAPDGRSDPNIAQSTARYICEKCHKAIHNEDRRRMMRAGVWAPAGCTVDKKGKLCGTPDRKCDVWGGQLSSLYSLQMQWGDIAKKFVESKRSSQLLQVFVNDWLAETWEPYRVKSEPEEVADRIATDAEVGVMPEWSTWRFDAVDVQEEFFKWVTVAAGPNERVAVVDSGICDTWGEVFDQCVNRPVGHADGGEDLLPCLTLIDSGDGKKTDEVYKKCREWTRNDRLVVPCKGANTDMGGEPYKVLTITPGSTKASRVQRRRALKANGTLRVRVNSYYYEPIIQRWLDSRKPEEPDSLSLPEELADDEEFMRELCNGVQSDNPSKMDPDRLLWVKRWGSEANDFRDCVKYCRCAIDLKFRGNWRMAERRQPSVTQIESAPSSPAAQAHSVRRPERRVIGGRRVQLTGRRVSR